MHGHLRQRISVTALVAIVFCLLTIIGVFSNFQLRLSDSLYGGTAASDVIIIAAIDDKSLQELGRWPWERSVFADLISALNESAVIGFDVAFFEPSNPHSDSLLADAAQKSGNVVVPVEFMVSGTHTSTSELLTPIPDLADAVAATGYVNVLTDGDSITRAVPFGISPKQISLSEAIVSVYSGQKPVVPEGRALINFVGPASSFTTLPITDILNGRVSPKTLEGKIVLVGATAPDLHDDYFVPTSRGKAMPGVEVHANTVQMILTNNYLNVQQPFWAVISIIFFSGLIFACTMLRKMWLGVVCSCTAAILYLFYAIWMFSNGIIINIVHVALSGFTVYIASVAVSYILERREKAKVTEAFGKYVSPVVVGEILKHPEKLKLGGEKRVITIFFSDIRGFTSFSEKLAPEELVTFLNQYLSAMTKIILKHGGLVDKYIGDAIMAFWGAPLEQPDHAMQACETSIEMLQELDGLSKNWKGKNLPLINIGIGLNTGEAVIGNMGSFERFDYTAMGDTINLGSRLEGLNKEYGTNIIISESTHMLVKEMFITRKLDFVKVKGKNNAIEIFELVGKEVPQKEKEFITQYEAGLALYKKREWAHAKSVFEKCLAFKDDNDKASRIMVERCIEYKKHPPADDWDGSHQMKTK